MAKVVFMGTPEFSIPTLKALIVHHDVLGVVTQPDRPAGRSGEIRPPPVKIQALIDDIPIFQPVKIRKPEAIEKLMHWRPDVYVVAAFGQILPQEVLDIPLHGSINVHASLLPRWRGAAPIHAAIRAGDDKTGITIMKMDAGLDTGPTLSAGALKILSDDTAQTLHDKLAQLGADLIINTLPGYLSGSIKPQAQPEDGITYAPQIKKEDGEIDWTQSAVSIERLVRAFTPWPGTFTYWGARQLNIHAGYVGDSNLEAGRVDNIDGRLAIGTGEGIYYPTVLQLEGKQSLPVAEFLRGRSDIVGVTLGHKRLA